MDIQNKTDIEIKGELHKRTVVFADTGFFRNYKPEDTAYEDFFSYAENEDIILCASFIALEEWRTQKVNNLDGLIGNAKGHIAKALATNPFTSAILKGDTQINFPEKDHIIKESKHFLKQFIETTKMIVYWPKEAHIQPTWDAYFSGEVPFSYEKSREDIPDAWIFEAAKDAIKDYETVPHKFCISSDKGMNGNLDAIGFQPIELINLLIKLKKQEEGSLQDVPEQLTVEEVSSPEARTLTVSALDKLLVTAINDISREVYLRVLGYTHWLDAPAKEVLVSVIAGHGFDPGLISACITILSQPSLTLIKDTGSHILPVDQALCAEAADRIMPEILEALDKE